MLRLIRGYYLGTLVFFLADYALVGLSGAMEIDISGGKHAYVFEYMFS